MRTVKESDIGRWDAGCAAYGRGECFEAHEHWEAVWNGLPDGPLRNAVRASVQVAAAHHRLRLVATGRLPDGPARAGAGRIVGRARANVAACPLPSLAAWLHGELTSLEAACQSSGGLAIRVPPVLEHPDRAALIAALGPQAPAGPCERFG